MYYLYTENGKKLVCDLNDFFIKDKLLENVGELYVNSINQDGTGNGLDFSLAELIHTKSDIPFIISGGIGKIADIEESLRLDFINAVSTAHLLNFIGDSLQNTRRLCLNKGIDLAMWPNLKDVI